MAARRNLAPLLALLLLGLAAPTLSSAAELGPVLEYQKTAHGIAGRTAVASFDIAVYSANVVRVRAWRSDAPPRAGYALTQEALPVFAQFETRANARQIVVSTAAIRAEIELEPRLRISFKDANGVVINEDLGGKELGTTFTGDKLTVYKRLQDGERFIGLGEALGNLDRRGTVVTLRNTDNYRYDDPKVPMYASIPFFTGLHHGKV